MVIISIEYHVCNLLYPNWGYNKKSYFIRKDTVETTKDNGNVVSIFTESFYLDKNLQIYNIKSLRQFRLMSKETAFRIKKTLENNETLQSI